MMLIRTSRCLLAATAYVLVVAPASSRAQSVADSFAELQGQLKSGQIVVVTDNNGKTTKGDVRSISDTGLEIVHHPPYGFGVPESRAFSSTTVTEIKVADPLRNGFLIGAAVGAGAGILTAASAYSGGGGDLTTGGYALIFGVFQGVGGGVVGATIDRFLQRTVYKSPTPRRGAKVTPLLEMGRQGVLASFRF